MAHFRFAVSGQVLDLLTPTKGISDDLNVNTAEFEFRSSDWANLDKWAHFMNPDYNEGLPYDYNLIGDAISADRGLNLPAGIWEVFVTGEYTVNNEVIQRRVTETQSIQIVQSSVVNGEPLAQITPSAAEQIDAKAQLAYNARITAASIYTHEDDQHATPDADVFITGEEGTKELKFHLYNIRGKTSYEQAVEGGYGGTEEEFDAFLANNSYFCVCTTSGSSPYKVVNIPGVPELNNGLSIYVLFLYGNTFAGPYLSVDNVANPIVRITSDPLGAIDQGALLHLIYYGNKWYTDYFLTSEGHYLDPHNDGNIIIV